MRANSVSVKANIVLGMILVGLMLCASVAMASQESSLPKAVFSASEDMSLQSTGSTGRCGCDNLNGIKMYVNNLIGDAQQRGMDCEMAQIHSLACIQVYCSICSGEPGAAERCVAMASDYFTHSQGYCMQKQEPTLPVNVTAALSAR